MHPKCGKLLVARVRVPLGKRDQPCEPRVETGALVNREDHVCPDILRGPHGFDHRCILSIILNTERGVAQGHAAEQSEAHGNQSGSCDVLLMQTPHVKPL